MREQSVIHISHMGILFIYIRTCLYPVVCVYIGMCIQLATKRNTYVSWYFYKSHTGGFAFENDGSALDDRTRFA